MDSLEHYEWHEVRKMVKSCRLSLDYSEIIEKLEAAPLLKESKEDDIEQVGKIINCFTEISAAEKNQAIEQFKIEKNSALDYFENFTSEQLKSILINPQMR